MRKKKKERKKRRTQVAYAIIPVKTTPRYHLKHSCLLKKLKHMRGKKREKNVEHKSQTQ